MVTAEVRLAKRRRFVRGLDHNRTRPTRSVVAAGQTGAPQIAVWPVYVVTRTKFDRPFLISGLQRLALIVDLVGFFLPLSFSPGSCTRDEDFIVTLTINKDDPRLGS